MFYLRRLRRASPEQRRSHPIGRARLCRADSICLKDQAAVILPKASLFFAINRRLFFATICSRKRRSHLANDSVHNALVESWRVATAWLIGFYLVMPDHLHLFCGAQRRRSHT